MQKMKKITIILMTVIMWLTTLLPVCAATNKQDGVEIILNTDLQEYDSNQVITTVVTVKNTNAYALEDVNVGCEVPVGYQLKESGPQKLAVLGANESVTLTGKVAPGDNAMVGAVSTGDSNHVLLWCMFTLCTVAGVVVLRIVYRKNLNGFAAVLLCLMMLASLLPANLVQASAADVQSLSTYETIKVAGKDVQVKATVTYKISESDSEEEETADTNMPIEPEGDSTEDSNGSSTPEGDGTEGGSGSNTPEDSGTEGDSGSNTPEDGGTEGGSGSNTPEDGGTEGGSGSDTPGDSTGGSEEETPQGPVDILKNGSFESTENSSINYWVAPYWRDVVSAEADAERGTIMKISTDQNVYVEQKVYVKSDHTGELSIWYKADDTREGMVDVAFYDKDDVVISSVNSPYLPKEKGWAQYTMNVELPENTVAVGVRLRSIVPTNQKGTDGSVYYDDCSLIFEEADLSLPEKEPGNQPLPDAENMIKNGGFEEIGEGGKGAADWEGWKGNWDYTTDGSVIITEGAYNGERSLQLSNHLAWARQYVTGLQQGAEYRLSAWVKMSAGGKGVFKFEYYDAEGKTMPESMSKFIAPTNNEWIYFEHYITIPYGCEKICVYPRIYDDVQGNTSTFYVDDIELYQTLAPEKYTLETDNYVYYTEWKDTYQGHANITINTKAYPEYTQGTASFALMDGDTVIDSDKNVAFTGETVSWTFDINDLAELKKEYTVKGTLCDKDGNEIETKTTPVYRYNRPTGLDADGNILVDDNDDGVKEIFNPVIVYHAPVADYERLAAAGINTVQFYKQGDLTYEEALDKAESLGIKVLFPLYFNMKPAADPANQASTKSIVETYKDHPAIIGWMIMDEPYNHDPNPEEALMASYKMIRDIDDENVIFCMENLPQYYQKVARFADVLGIDPYPENRQPVLSYVEHCIDRAHAAVDNRKPIHSVLQAYLGSGYFPDGTDMRHMLYDAFFSGTNAVGYYCFETAQPGVDLDETALWSTLTAFASDELENAFDVFTHNKYPICNEGQTEDVQYLSYIKANKLYVIALCENTNGATVQIPLVKEDKTTVFGAFDAKILYGGEGTFTGTDTLEMTLVKGQAVVVEVTEGTGEGGTTTPPEGGGGTGGNEGEGGTPNPPEGGEGTGGNEGDSGTTNPPAEDTNLVKNGGFEDVNGQNIKEWGVYGAVAYGNQMKQTQILGPNGENTNVLHFTTTGAVTQSISLEDITTGTKGTFSINYQNNLGGYESIELHFYNGFTKIADSKEVNGTGSFWPSATNAGEWKEFSQELTVPEGANKLQIIIRATDRNNTTECSVYYDDAKFILE